MDSGQNFYSYSNCNYTILDLSGCVVYKSKYDICYRFKGFPPKGTNKLQRIDLFMLLDLLGTNDPEPTILSTQQSGHVSHYHQLQEFVKIRANFICSEFS